MDFTPEHNEYRIKDRIGTWSIIVSYFDKDNKRWFLLMESCQYGDEAGCVVVYFYAEKAEGVIMKHYVHKKIGGRLVFMPEFQYELCETWDDIKTALEDEGIL